MQRMNKAKQITKHVDYSIILFRNIWRMNAFVFSSFECIMRHYAEKQLLILCRDNVYSETFLNKFCSFVRTILFFTL